jgi:hypothetical protein
LGFISAVATQAVISAIGAQLLLAQIVIAYAVTYSVTYIATGSGKAAQGAGLAVLHNLKFQTLLICIPWCNLRIQVRPAYAIVIALKTLFKPMLSAPFIY